MNDFVNRLFWLKAVIGIGFLSSVLVAPNVWLSTQRTFPTLPAFDFIRPFEAPVDSLILGLMLFLLLLIIFFPRPKISILIFLGLLLVLLVPGDLSRLQPWVYQYFFLFAALGAMYWKRTTEKTAVIICQFVVASTYFWSGVQKFNPVFFQETLPWMFSGVPGDFVYESGLLGLIIAVAIPLGEAGLGVGLLIPRLRKYAVTALVSMHIFILILIGPLFHSWNIVVWPWNIAMIIVVVLLFWRESENTVSDVFWPKRSILHGLTLILFGVMPALSFFSYWDSYLSSSLYSGNIAHGTLIARGEYLDELAPGVSAMAIAGEDEKLRLSILTWAIMDLSVPPYPEARVYRKLLGSACQQISDPSQMQLEIRHRVFPFFAERRETYGCDDLNNSL